MIPENFSIRILQSIRRAIPQSIHRIPLFHPADSVKYSSEKNLRRKLRGLKTVFPNGMELDSEQIQYEHCYILAMTARVGSTALVASLTAAGLSDYKIREIFNNRGSMKSFANHVGAKSLPNYLNQYARLSGNNRLPFKVGWWDMAPIVHLSGDKFDQLFPNATWVYLERRDKVAQAYSLWKAAKHDIWHVQQGEEYQCPVNDLIPLDRIRVLLSLIKAENDGWKSFFKEHGIKHTCIYYEDFAENPKDVTEQAYRGFTGEEMNKQFECPITKSSDEADQRNVEKLRIKLLL